MSIVSNISDKKVTERVEVKCDYCQKEFHMLLICAKRNMKKNNGSIKCLSCSSKEKAKHLPQCKSSYWTENKKLENSEKIKSSKKYRDGIKNRKDQSGENNGMYGKQHTNETKKKMSEVRKDRYGPLAPNWQGGKTSVNKRIRKILHTTFDWYRSVYRRDNWTCQECGSKRNLDAHHITPLSCIIDLLCENMAFDNEASKVEYLIKQPEITDVNNGITLCRCCHKETHDKWGTHYAKIKNI